MGSSIIKKGGIAICPIDSESLTKNKEYTIQEVFSDSNFKIKNDENKTLYCQVTGCGHIEGGNWILKQ